MGRVIKRPKAKKDNVTSKSKKSKAGRKYTVNCWNQ